MSVLCTDCWEELVWDEKQGDYTHTEAVKHPCIRTVSTRAERNAFWCDVHKCFSPDAEPKSNYEFVIEVCSHSQGFIDIIWLIQYLLPYMHEGEIIAKLQKHGIAFLKG